MKPGTSFLLRFLLAASITAAISASPISRAHADKLPIKQVQKPILQGEPENPDGTIPLNLQPTSSSAFVGRTGLYQTERPLKQVSQAQRLFGQWFLRFLSVSRTWTH